MCNVRFPAAHGTGPALVHSSTRSKSCVTRSAGPRTTTLQPVQADSAPPHGAAVQLPGHPDQGRCTFALSDPHVVHEHRGPSCVLVAVVVYLLLSGVTWATMRCRASKAGFLCRPEDGVLGYTRGVDPNDDALPVRGAPHPYHGVVRERQQGRESLSSGT
jgi:hypothetical protein